MLIVYHTPEEKIKAALNQMPIEIEEKENFWNKYLNARKKLNVKYRISQEERFLKKIINLKEPKEIQRMLYFELWFVKFKEFIDEVIVDYFAKEFEYLNSDQQQRIFEALENATASTNINTLFNWLFQQYIVEKTLTLLDSNSLFNNQGSDEIISYLAMKYQHQEVPIEIKYRVAKTVKDKAALKWDKQKILKHLYDILN